MGIHIAWRVRLRFRVTFRVRFKIRFGNPCCVSRIHWLTVFKNVFRDLTGTHHITNSWVRLRVGSPYCLSRIHCRSRHRCLQGPYSNSSQSGFQAACSMWWDQPGFLLPSTPLRAYLSNRARRSYSVSDSLNYVQKHGENDNIPNGIYIFGAWVKLFLLHKHFPKPQILLLKVTLGGIS